MRLLSVVLVVAAVALAGCGSSSSSTSSTATTTASSPSSLNTAKFVLHAGLAFGAFHRYIYKPIKEGKLSSPLSHKLTALKAAAAAAFMVHEIKGAVANAQGSPALAKLVLPLSALAAGVKSAVTSAKGGSVSTAQLEEGKAAIESIKSSAASSGASIAEQSPSLP
jgi:hypothetical protein